mmetsp:Transcript_11577/g.24694  ORF Transcript_11577/g.24694 Transcript_11577/m.24694 type:complete len:810 (+) Transcript_11577:551-2980(+)|eukprot:CAMPEP_0183732386 /NCGR_PEP_ID=MMETSP0737-20130205/38324_1 /TAXON_ID=385413 /ORGANISM="Thalassiosira miniscula, Strain CCMP1093" /LENGTH=809 /DNA_ID=CAMNT_0025965393 /DNA_START=428 /DNA_END=2857 /DNA_ORIENTATION=+
MNMAHDNHHLASLDIENDGEESASSLMHSDSSSSGIHNRNNKTQPQHLPSPSITPPRQRVVCLPGGKTNLPLLTACYMAALTTGATTYAFSFYSNALKTSLHLSQNQLDTLSSATFCAGILSWMPGMVVDHFGAKAAMALGGTSNVVMLTLYWLIATERWELMHTNSHGGLDQGLLMFVLSTLGVLIFMGCALVTGSVFKVIVESCGSGSKGKAVGCAKGYVGVGSGVYVCLFGALFGASGAPIAGPELLSIAKRKIATSLDSGTTSIMKLASMLPPSSWTSLSNPLTSIPTTASMSTLTADVPQNPELLSLNFLLMAAALSFLASTLPALCLLPSKVKSTTSPRRRDGTRSIHFRVIYAGLAMLGMWVVGVSLMQLREDQVHNKNGQPSNTGGGGGDAAVNPNQAPSILDNNTLLPEEDGSIIDLSTAGAYTSYARKLVDIATHRILSSSAPERHWGAVFLLLSLWWGPALSMLFIPPRKESSEDESRMYESPVGRNEEQGAFDYDDENNEQNSNGGINANGNLEGYENEEETFLQDGNPSINHRGKGGGGGDSPSLSSEGEPNYTLVQMLKTSPAWLMAWTCVILVGGGTVMTNNIGQMTEALGFPSDLTPASLALFSAAQGASRVMTGIASELALKWKLPRWLCGSGQGSNVGIPRPAFLTLASLVSAASHLVLAVSTSEGVFAMGVTLSGVAFGMVWPMMVLITGEVFGTRHVGANYMFFDGFSSAAGTLLLSKFVAQEVYDEHIVESHGDPGAAPASTEEGSYKCFGTGCFRMSHFIVSALSLTCIVSSVALVKSTRDVYSRRH